MYISSNLVIVQVDYQNTDVFLFLRSEKIQKYNRKTYMPVRVFSQLPNYNYMLVTVTRYQQLADKSLVDQITAAED